MEQPYLITGCQNSAKVFPRLEIRDLQRKTEQFTLFILSLAQIMTPEHRPKASRFEDLGGIHGLPYERWMGDPNVADVQAQGTWGGYCNHESVLFPTWHRPYVLAIEQSIWEAATRLARRWTRHSPKEEATLWQNAANELRFPYWDWTDERTGTDGLPDVLQPQTFTFELPGGVMSDPIDNPLAFYDFGSRVPDGFKNSTWKTPLAADATSFFKDWRRTYRWPSSKENPIEDYIKIKEILVGSETQRGSWKQLRTQVANLFTFPATADKGQGSYIWDEFSNTTFQSKNDTNWTPAGIASIESPHNSVHLVLGGLGDMADNDYAGFDPIFFLHHCNVDRILAFWEYVYANYWMDDGYVNKEGKVVPFTQVDGTWDEDDDAKIDQSSTLDPFRKGDQGYWNGSDTRFLQSDLKVKKWYTYPPIGDVSVDAPLPSTLEQREIYIRTLQKHFGLYVIEATPSDSEKIVHPIFTSPVGEDIDGHNMIANYRRFFVDVELAGHAFNGSYMLQLVYKKKVVASVAVLARGEDTQCAACKLRSAAGGKVHGVMDIPHDVIAEIIVDAGQNHRSASTDNLIATIRGNFSVRLVGPSGVLLADAIQEVNILESDSRRSPLDKRITPKLQLRSAAAAYRPSQPDRGLPRGPVEFFDWADHDNMLSDGHKWKTV